MIALGILQGKILSRILSDSEIMKLKLNGKVLDIGGTKNDYYHRYSNFSHCRITTMNINGKADVYGNVENRFPFDDEVFDYVVAFRVLEHIYDIENLMGEVKRVLKQRGQFYVYVPFLYPFHKDPSDYYRYTHVALERIFKETGFIEISVTIVGFGPFTSSLLILNTVTTKNLFFRLFCALIYPIARICDWLLIELRKEIRQHYALGYLVTARKGQA